MKELRHLNKYFRKYRFKLILGVVITIIARVFALFLPSYANKALEVMQLYVNDGLPKEEALSTLALYIGIIIGTAAASALFTFFMRQTIINVSRYIEFDLKNEVYEHYQKLSQGFYKDNRIGDLMNRISEDVTQVRMYGGPVIMYGITTLTLFAILIPLMFIKAPELAMYTLLPLPFLSVLIYQISRIIHLRSTKVQEYLSTLSTFSQESFAGISVIKAYALEPQINGEMEELSEEGKQTSMNLAKVNAWFFPLMMLLIGVSNINVIYIGGQQYINDEIGLGLIAEFIIYVNMLTWPVAVVGWLTSVVQRAEASQKRINEFLQQEPAIVSGSLLPETFQGEVVFDQVSFTYPDTGIEALKAVSFTVEPGQTLAILGKTGAGKTTVLELVSRLYDVSSGQILIDGNPIEELELTALRNHIGAVPQEAFLFSDTLENNIRFGDHNAPLERIQKYAQKAVVHDNIMGFTKQYETLLGERGITLSGGQKQRVSIARALIREPRIYLFDDCLSAVDTETEEEILNNLQSESQNRTTFIVSHRVSAARHADQILILDKGAIIQSGTHEQLVSVPGYYKDLYEEQLAAKD
jgi:ATP-binding cassette subfamily B protein